MRWLRLAIARLLGLPTPFMVEAPVQPTPTAGPVDPEHMTQAGSKPSVAGTQPQPPSLPAQARSRKKPKAAPQTTAGSKSTSKKSKPVQTGKSPTSDGNSTPTPARRTRRHAK